MRTKSLLLGVSLALLGLGFSSCSEISFYEIDAPATLEDQIQHRLDSLDALGGDREQVTITVQYVGAEDCSAAWWTEFSQYFTIPTNKMLCIEFTNYTSGAGNWNNWNLCVSTPVERDGTGYSEYFVLRSDAYGWGNADYNANMISIDYQDLDGDGDIWNDFRSMMQGAHVVMKIDHSSTGNVYVTATQTSADGSVTFTETYEHPVPSTADIQAFLVVDGSHLEITDAYLTSSEVTELEDFNAVSIVASGTPTNVDINSEAEAVWGSASAVVTFEDGSVETVGYEDLNFVMPDLTTLGTKTVVYSYSKTKLGNYGNSVAGYYNIEVINPVTEISAVANVYAIGGARYATLSPAAVAVTGTLSDGSTRPLLTSEYTVEFEAESLVYPAAAATLEDAFTVYYQGSSEVLECTGDIVFAASDQPAQTEQVGASDFSSAWWTVFSTDWKVDAGESQTVSMTLYSNAVNNWNSPTVVLRGAELNEYAVVRMDNYGWGDYGYGTAVLTSDWNWDLFAANMNGSKVSITVTNPGDGTANVRYYVEWPNGDTHFQYYDGVTVDAEDLNFCIATEGAYLVFD